MHFFRAFAASAAAGSRENSTAQQHAAVIRQLSKTKRSKSLTSRVNIEIDSPSADDSGSCGMSSRGESVIQRNAEMPKCKKCKHYHTCRLIHIRLQSFVASEQHSSTLSTWRAWRESPLANAITIPIASRQRASAQSCQSNTIVQC